MKNILIVLFLSISIFSCSGDISPVDDKIYTDYCSYESQEKRAAFVLTCIEKANPMSDEEPEDWIRECTDSAEDIYCFWGDQFQAKKHYDRLGQKLQEEL